MGRLRRLCRDIGDYIGMNYKLHTMRPIALYCVQSLGSLFVTQCVFNGNSFDIVQITEAAVLEGGSVTHQLSVISMHNQLLMEQKQCIFKQTHSFA